MGQQRHQTISIYDMMAGVEPKSPQVQRWHTCASCYWPLLLLCQGTGADTLHCMRYLLRVNEWHYYYLSKAPVWGCCSEHPWCWQNKSIFMPCGQNCHSYLDLHHVHKVPWKICLLCMWGNGSENTDNFQNACFEFQCLLLVLANSELLLVYTKSLTLHVK